MDGYPLSNAASLVDSYVREDVRAIANFHIVAHIGKRGNVDVLADLGCGRDKS